MTLYVAPIVEGHTEVLCTEPLLHRIWNELLGAPERLQVVNAVRGNRSSIVSKHHPDLVTKIEEATDRLRPRLTKDPSGRPLILLLLDADKECPRVLRADLVPRLPASAVPVACVLARRQFENWFVAGASTLGGHGGLPATVTVPADPEDRSGVNWLDDHIRPASNRGYSKTNDSGALTRHMKPCRRPHPLPLLPQALRRTPQTPPSSPRAAMRRLRVIDSHTAGEPTRVVLDGGPDLGIGPLAARRDRFRTDHDRFRSAAVNEPRGGDVLVGALLLSPDAPDCVTGVVFFNNVSTLGMCGHGTIGLAVSLGHLGRIAAGSYRLDTPVGVVPFDYDGANRVSLENVPAYRLRRRVPVEIDGRTLHGDVAWGGNWFFLVDDHGLALDVRHAAALTDLSLRVKRALVRDGVTGADGAEIDHVELTGPPADPANHGRNFVLCPGNAYDRSPCGTGTSAKLACLHADGKLAPGDVWRQEGILGGVFEGSVRLDGGRVLPRITGSAFVTAEATLIIDPNDPLGWGVRP